MQAAVRAGADFIGFVHYQKSPRHVSIEQAAKLKSLLPPSVKSVMVVVNPNDELLAEIASKMSPDFFQLHGEETPERVAEIRKNFPQIGIIKAIAIRDLHDIESAKRYSSLSLRGAKRQSNPEPQNWIASPQKRFVARNDADYLLFDAKPTDKNMMHGGNGIAFDWDLLANYSCHPDTELAKRKDLLQRQDPSVASLSQDDNYCEEKWFLSGGLNAKNVAEAIHKTGAKMVDVSSGVESSAGVKDVGLIAEFVKAVRE